MKILAVIPAKRKSTRVKNKNLKKFYKSSLVEIAIKSATQSKFVTDVCVTSESKKIEKFKKKYSFIFVKRPINLSNSSVMADAAVIHAYKQIKKKFDYIVMLQPTSPLRTSKDIDNAIKRIIYEKSDSLLSVFKSHGFIWKNKKKTFKPLNYNFLKRPNSQSMSQFQENGAIYITKPKTYEKNKNRLGGKISFYEMSFWKSFEIDSLDDFVKVEKLYSENTK